MRSLPVGDLVATFRLHKIQSVLEVGCGTGALVRDLIDQYGAEFDASGMEETDHDLLPFFKSNGARKHFQIGSPLHEEQIPGPVDAIISRGHLSELSVEEVPVVLRNLRSKTRKLGYFSVDLGTIDLAAMANKNDAPASPHSPKWWMQQFAAAGFPVLDNRIAKDAETGHHWLHLFAGAVQAPATYGAQGAAAASPEIAPPQNAVQATDGVQGDLELALNFHRKNEINKALPIYERVLESEPGNADALHGIGMITVDRGDLDEGEQLLRAAIEADETKPSFHSNLGHCLALAGKVEESVKAHLKAVELAPKVGIGHNNLANVLRDAGHIEESTKAFETAIRLEPTLSIARMMLCQNKLLEGDTSAVSDLRWGFEAQSRKWFGVPLPEYQGQDLRDGGLALWGDWGIGDQVMFLRLMPHVIERVDRNVLVCDERLVPLLGRSFPGVECVAPMHPLALRNQLPWVTHQMPICELGTVFGIEPDKLGDGSVFFSADATLTEQLAARYRRKTNNKLVGIAWRGGAKAETRALRSIPLDQWSDVLTQKGCTFVSLQYGDVAQEIDDAKKCFDCELVSDSSIDQMKNLDGFAAQIAAMDLLITTDCTAAHIAGALGVPTLILLPKVPDWRWGLEGTETPWYASVRLLRQSELHHWEEPLASAAEELALLVQQ